MDRSLRTVALVAAAYVAAQILSDVGSLRIVTIGGMSMDAGTLIYPVTFTLRDLAQKAGGKQLARMLVFLAAGINLLMALYFQLVAALPPDATVGPQPGFGEVLAPVWRIVLASIVAEVVAQLIDGEVYDAWVRRFGERAQWGRVLTSNAVAVPVDSALFVTLAFAGVIPISSVIAIFWTNVLLKLVVAVASIPLIYLVRPRSTAGEATPKEAAV